MKALLVIDVQNDFLKDGTLAVPEGNSIIEGINNISSLFSFHVFTKDWHPSDHDSFKCLWAKHCIQYSYGAEFPSSLYVPPDSIIIYKGTNSKMDSYSAFFDNNKEASTPLNLILTKNKIDIVYICGLATDYCVKYSALDAVALGYNTYVIKDLTKGVNDFQKALDEMKNHNIQIINSNDITDDTINFR